VRLAEAGRHVELAAEEIAALERIAPADLECPSGALRPWLGEDRQRRGANAR
jgi:hypothetical protein